MATTITFSNESRAVPAVRVYTREFWTDPWVERERLHCDYVLWAANPDMGKAQFTWHFGRVAHPDIGGWLQFSRIDVLRHFVKVEIDQPVEDPEDEPLKTKWFGVMEESSVQDKGVGVIAGSERKSGRQTLVAYSLDFLLSRHVLQRSVVRGSSGEEITIERAIEFNAKSQLDSLDEKVESGNRSPDVGPGGVHLFATNLATAKFWTTLDAAQYLLKYHVPPNEDGDIVIQWQLGLSALLGDVPDWDKPRVACHNRSLRDVLDDLIDRRRLIGWNATVEEVEDGDDKAELSTFTFTPEALTYEDNTIPANVHQFALVFDADTAVQMAFLRTSTLQAVDQVLCVGARAVACFTISPQSDPATLVPGWTGDQQLAYDNGASGVTGYGSMEIWEQEERNKQARSRPDVARVYAYFNLPDTWDGATYEASGDPLGGGWYFDAVNDPFEPLAHYHPQLRFRNQLPLKTDHDYKASKIADGTVTDTTPTGQKWEYRPMLVAIALPNTTPVRYQAINDIGINTERPLPDLGTADGVQWSASVRAQQDAPGFVITVRGKPQFVIAADDFSPLPVDEADVSIFEWQTLVATVAMEVDRYCTGVWPATAAESESGRRLVIDLGDEFQQHYVALGTVVNVAADGTLEQTTSGGFVRDDGAKLTALARLVYEWYKTERQQVELNFGYIVHELMVGDLITTVSQGSNQQTVNTVVTQKKYEFPLQEGSVQAATARTTITTDFAEFDIRRFVLG